MKRQFIRTADGSSSIYLKDMDEHYHSKHGAITESEHIFVQNGLLSLPNRPLIRVFEVGMGTGLNVLTTLKASTLNNLKVHYETIEAFPILEHELEQINYDSLLQMGNDLLIKIHSSVWGEDIEFNNGFYLKKYKQKLQEYIMEEESFDVVYFDAFAPEKQPEMWTPDIFCKLYKGLKEGGALVTYCVKGEIRRRLQSVGFAVEKLKGPVGGKREMCRAWK